MKKLVLLIILLVIADIVYTNDTAREFLGLAETTIKEDASDNIGLLRRDSCIRMGANKTCTVDTYEVCTDGKKLRPHSYNCTCSSACDEKDLCKYKWKCNLVGKDAVIK